MKLINAPPSPFGRKVSIALIEKGVSFETEWDLPWNSETIVPRYNPLEQLPILIADDGEIAYDSVYLMEWVERRFPNPPLLPQDDDGILEAKKLMVLAEGVMTAAAGVGGELSRPGGGSAAWIERQRRKIVGGTAALAQALEGREFAVRDTFSQADIGIGVTYTMFDFMAELYGFELVEERWRDSAPALATYVDQLETRGSFQATRPRPMEVDLEAIRA